jgi:hypothetical protein
VAKINKIKSQKSGANPEKTEKELRDFFIKQEQEKLKAPRQSPRQQLPILLDSAEAWKACFSANTGLIHMDFSNNGFTATEIEVIAEGLKENHTLLGIHMLGNEAATDAMGFVAPNRSPGIMKDGNNSVFTRIEPSFRYG